MALVVGAVILLCLTIPAIAIPRVASPVHQVTPRANYIGGWPLGLAGTGAACPGYASQTCDAGAYSSLNTQCCPTGQSCIASLISAYCCPTTADCNTAVTNFPVCANSSWTMFSSSTTGYFCCEPGQIGVNPIASYDGLCEPADQAVPTSLLAKTATQVGGTVSTNTASVAANSPPSSTSSASQSIPTKSPTESSLITTSSGSSSQPTGSSSSSGISSGTGSSSSSQTPTASNGKSPVLSTGAIIGVVIGGLAIILLAGILWALITRRKPKPPVYAPTPVAEQGIEPLHRKPVAQTTTTSTYSVPPQYSTSPERYDPPPTRSPMSNNPYDRYQEMEDPNRVERAELRADRTGN